MRIAMMGSGGIGGCIGARLAEAGVDVSFIARLGNPVITALEDICAKAKGIGLKSAADIESVLWEKFVTLSAFSGGTALMRSGIGPIFADDEARTFIEQLRDEGMAVAAAAGHPMSEGFVDRVIADGKRSRRKANHRWRMISSGASRSRWPGYRVACISLGQSSALLHPDTQQSTVHSI